MKLNRYHVIIIGVVLIIGGACAMIFGPIKSTKAQLVAKESELAGYQQKANGLAAAQEAKVKAEAALSTQQKHLTRDMNQRMPEIALGDRIQGMISYWKECGDVMGPTIERFMMSRSGVISVTGLQIASPSTNPNDINSTLITVPLGNVAVQLKDFRHALRFFKAMKNCPRLVSIQNVKLDKAADGNGVILTMGLNAYIYPTGGESGGTISEAGTGTEATGGAGGAMPGAAGAAASPAGPGMPGGMPGGAIGGGAIGGGAIGGGAGAGGAAKAALPQPPAASGSAVPGR